MSMKRVSFKMYLKPDCIEEYKRRHNELWPEIKQLLTNEGVHDYSIFLIKKQMHYLLYKKLKAMEIRKT